MNKNAYRGHRFPPAIIQVTVWMYARFTLSLRDVEELLAERGLDISYETVRRWFLKFGQVYARSIRHRRHRPTDRWYLDEMVIVMGRRRFSSPQQDRFADETTISSAINRAVVNTRRL